MLPQLDMVDVDVTLLLLSKEVSERRRFMSGDLYLAEEYVLALEGLEVFFCPVGLRLLDLMLKLQKAPHKPGLLYNSIQVACSYIINVCTLFIAVY